jgi:hypothetical protein
MKSTKRLFYLLLIAFSVYPVEHKNLSGTQLHSPYRWIFADSATMSVATLSATDTNKTAFRSDDNTVWVLRNAGSKTWKQVGGIQFDSLTSDSIYQRSNRGTTAIYDSSITTKKIIITGGPTLMYQEITGTFAAEGSKKKHVIVPRASKLLVISGLGKSSWGSYEKESAHYAAGNGVGLWDMYINTGSTVDTLIVFNNQMPQDSSYTVLITYKP